MLKLVLFMSSNGHIKESCELSIFNDTVLLQTFIFTFTLRLKYIINDINTAFTFVKLLVTSLLKQVDFNIKSIHCYVSSLPFQILYIVSVKFRNEFILFFSGVEH